jgi:hypothetical protein
MTHFLRHVGALLALSAIAYGVGCEVQHRSTAQATADELEAQACELDLGSLRDGVSQYADLPDESDVDFYRDAARLTDLQRRLEVARSVAHRFESAVDSPSSAAMLGMTDSTAEVERAYAQGGVDRIQALVTALVSDAASRGHRLASDDGAPMEGKRAMQALFWRRTGRAAANAVADCRSAEHDDRTAARALAEGARAVALSDAHDLVEHTEMRALMEDDTGSAGAGQ